MVFAMRLRYNFLSPTIFIILSYGQKQKDDSSQNTGTIAIK
jgi:hypothetical protein